jgi:hypothetical protein
VPNGRGENCYASDEFTMHTGKKEMYIGPGKGAGRGIMKTLTVLEGGGVQKYFSLLELYFLADSGDA